MKKILLMCLSLLLFASALVSCEDWTEPESKMFLKGDGHDDAYYAALRKWKAETDYDMAWGWFGGWGANATNLKNSLRGLPDSLYLAAIWGRWRPSVLTDAMKADIDLRYVRGFDMFLQKRGCCGNTRKFYFKALRAILNRANAEGVGSVATYPFGRGGFEVSKLEEATAKRYLPAAELSKLKSTTASNPQCEYARKLFLFSYYCYGISFIDMAMLTTAQIKQMEDGDYIVYKRQKIKRQKGVKPISIKITPAIRQLIGSLQAASPTVDDFLLPIVTRSGYTGERLYMHIRTRYSKYQKYLCLLAEELGIDFHLTSYVSRHTAAMTLQRNHIPREVISQMLGHADLETTNVYLDSFDNGVINKAAKVL